MLNFIARRWWLFAAALLLALLAMAFAVCVSTAAAIATFVAGGIVLVLARLFIGMRQVFKLVWEVRAEIEEFKAQFACHHGETHVRLALAERRLAAIAIKIDVTDELDDPSAR